MGPRNGGGGGGGVFGVVGLRERVSRFQLEGIFFVCLFFFAFSLSFIFAARCKNY